jgi:hypothetical protein
MGTRHDVTESTLRRADERTRESTGLSLLHWLTIGSIATSIGLFIAGKKELAIFVGLWPPTFQALRSAESRSGMGSTAGNVGSSLGM